MLDLGGPLESQGDIRLECLLRSFGFICLVPGRFPLFQAEYVAVRVLIDPGAEAFVADLGGGTFADVL